MKKVYIIHDWEGSSQLNWIPYARKSFQNLGFEVISPDMPNTGIPRIKEWVGYLKEIAKDNEN